ncbi:E3 ubiquitin/ISG15 ligase TRIM25-like [Mercenaria mercenaria]|uniref:E3 ubiquitin/ISG15 ligase TRIM25-like n=1 Tax=Mercenaria mercenaria TaxID=6596 RepID=UPI00234EB824|nr:E3 ubiquitin/ISG15 ligase TRIM25-like [Mercenaria mercenaria]
MAEKSVDSIKENTGLCCPVCFEKYHDPRSLTCAHTFCELCIHQFVLKQKSADQLKDGVECPLCRKVTAVTPVDTPPEKWSKALPGNYALQEVLASLENVKGRDEKMCKICPNDKTCKTATKFCIQCKNEICDDCEQIHYKIEGIRNHRIVAISEKETVRIIPDELDLCKAHNKKIEFYCIDEKKLCCSSCAIIKHRKCNEVAEIFEIAEKDNNETKAHMLMQMQSLKMKASSVKSFFQQRGREMESKIESMSQKMQLDHEQIIRMLEETRAKIMADAEEVKQKTLKSFELYYDECDTLISTVDSSVQTLESVQKHGSASQLFIALQKQESQLAEEIKKSEKCFKELNYPDLCFETAESVNDIINSTDMLGELKTHEIKVEIEEIPDIRKVHLEFTASIDVQAMDGQEHLPNYTGLAFLSDGRLAVVDNMNDTCLIMNKELETLKSYKHTDFLYDVISLPDNELLLTSSSSLVTVAVSNENDIMHEMVTDLKCKPYSVSLFDGENLVVGRYGVQTPVSILSKTGTEKHLGIKLPEKEWGIDDSRCTFDRNTRRLAITDRLEEKVYIYDTRNNDRIIITDERIREPGGVAFGPQDCVFVCSTGKDTVVQLSQFGEIIESLAVEMDLPTVMCISKSGTKLALSNSIQVGRKLQIYKIIPFST